MKKLLMLLAILLFAAPVWAGGPFLVCDVTGAEAYNVDMDGVVTTGVLVQLVWVKSNRVYFTDPGGITTQHHLLKDLATLPVGAHTVKAAGDYGVWGVSEWSVPLAFPKPTLMAPQGERLVK